MQNVFLLKTKSKKRVKLIATLHKQTCIPLLRARAPCQRPHPAGVFFLLKKISLSYRIIANVCCSRTGAETAIIYDLDLLRCTVCGRDVADR